MPPCRRHQSRSAEVMLNSANTFYRVTFWAATRVGTDDYVRGRSESRSAPAWVRADLGRLRSCLVRPRATVDRPPFQSVRTSCANRSTLRSAATATIAAAVGPVAASKASAYIALLVQRPRFVGAHPMTDGPV